MYAVLDRSQRETEVTRVTVKQPTAGRKRHEGAALSISGNILFVDSCTDGESQNACLSVPRQPTLYVTDNRGKACVRSF